jgi:hypothetical protein
MSIIETREINATQYNVLMSAAILNATFLVVFLSVVVLNMAFFIGMLRRK